MHHFSKQLHYCYIPLDAQIIYPWFQLPTWIPMSQAVQLVEAPYGPELTETLVSMTLGTGARPKIPKMTSLEETSSEEVCIYIPLWLNNSKNEQQSLWMFKLSLLDRLINQTFHSQDLVIWLPYLSRRTRGCYIIFFNDNRLHAQSNSHGKAISKSDMACKPMTKSQLDAKASRLCHERSQSPTVENDLHRTMA